MQGMIAEVDWRLTDLWSSHLQQMVACRGRPRSDSWLLQEVVSKGRHGHRQSAMTAKRALSWLH